MRPLARNTVDTRTSSLETRIAALERRIIPPPGSPYCIGNGTAGVQTLTSGQFVCPGFGLALGTDEHLYTHLPVTNVWDIGATTNIDGSLVVLQRGYYLLVGSISYSGTGPADAQLSEIQIVHTRLDDPTGTPSALFAWTALQVVGSHNAINSLATGINIDGQTQWVWIIMSIGSGLSFDNPYAFKLRLRIGTGGDRDFNSWNLSITRLSGFLCDSASFHDILGDGIPSDWELDEDCNFA